MSIDNWIELALAGIAGLNTYFALMIKSALKDSQMELLKLQLKITEKFISKDDFADWTKASSFLPTYTKDRGSRERI